MTILAGDVGGTNARLGLFEADGHRLRLLASRTFPSRQHESLEAVVAQFVAEHPSKLTRACIAIAGPVNQGRVLTTNLAWVVDAERVARALGLPRLALINDLEGIAHGLPELEPSDWVVLNEGAPGAEGNRGIIAAGTGLGQAGGYWDGRRHHPFACEGGHTDFGPRNALEIELLRYLMTRFDRVSYERVLSGSGLYEIYKFLQTSGGTPEPAWLTAALQREPPPAVIGRAALDGRSEVCRQALTLFVSVYGAEAGNLALKVMARGGIFVSGGIAPRILPALREPTFMEAFTAKGRLRPLLEAMPVRVVLNDKVGLLGAARYAVSPSALDD